MYNEDLTCKSPKNWPKAHSFPPSSLDRCCSMFIVSPKKVVVCRGGNRYFGGGLVFLLEIPIVQKNDWPKIPRFHATSQLVRKDRHFFKKDFDSVGFTYV